MHIFYLIYQWFFALPILLVATIITALVTIVGCMLGSGRTWGYYPAHLWSRLFCRLLLLPVHVEGREHIDKNTSYVFVANHQGAFDIFLVCGFLGHNFKWMLKESLRKIPLVGRACQAAGFIFVNRESKSSIRVSIEQAEKTLKDGMSMMVFPEGSRTKDGSLGRFKKGAYMLAVDLNLPVVPLTIEGSYKVMSCTAHTIHWSPLKLTIHPPIPPHSTDGHDLMSVLNESRSVIENRLQQN